MNGIKSDIFIIEDVIEEEKMASIDVASTWNNLKIVRDMKDDIQAGIKRLEDKKVNALSDKNGYEVVVNNCKKVIEFEDMLKVKTEQCLILQDSLKRVNRLKSEFSKYSDDYKGIDNRIKVLNDEINSIGDKIDVIKSKLDKEEQLRKICDGLESFKGLKFNYDLSVSELLEVEKNRDKAFGVFQRYTADFVNEKKVFTNLIENLKVKTLIFKDSNCIDISSAKCGFLIDAKQAEDDVIVYESKLRSLQDVFDREICEKESVYRDLLKEYEDKLAVKEEFEIDRVVLEISRKEKTIEDLNILEKDKEIYLIQQNSMIQKRHEFERLQRQKVEIGVKIGELSAVKFRYEMC